VRAEGRSCADIRWDRFAPEEPDVPRRPRTGQRPASPPGHIDEGRR
jgi:hypothetical protein